MQVLNSTMSESSQVIDGVAHVTEDFPLREDCRDLYQN